MKKKMKIFLIYWSNREQFVQNNNDNVFSDYSLFVNKMNGSHFIRDKREELGILFYIVLVLSWCGIILI